MNNPMRHSGKYTIDTLIYPTRRKFIVVVEEEDMHQGVEEGILHLAAAEELPAAVEVDIHSPSTEVAFQEYPSKCLNQEGDPMMEEVQMPMQRSLTFPAVEQVHDKPVLMTAAVGEQVPPRPMEQQFSAKD